MFALFQFQIGYTQQQDPDGRWSSSPVSNTSEIDDFRFSIDLSPYISNAWERILVDSKERSGNFSIGMILEQYAESNDRTKQLICDKQLSGWNFQELTEHIKSLIYAAGYRDTIKVVSRKNIHFESSEMPFDRLRLSFPFSQWRTFPTTVTFHPTLSFDWNVTLLVVFPFSRTTPTPVNASSLAHHRLWIEWLIPSSFVFSAWFPVSVLSLHPSMPIWAHRIEHNIAWSPSTVSRNPWTRFFNRIKRSFGMRFKGNPIRHF